MKRNEGCKGCTWNFGKDGFPCAWCEDYDLYFSWETGDKKGDSNNASIQQEDHSTNGLQRV